MHLVFNYDSRSCHCIRGKILHERFPQKHRFEYPFSFFHFEIKKLKSLSNQHNFFGYNQKRLLEIRDNDYLHSNDKPIFIAIEEFFGREASNERTLLVSSPRYLGAAFNPVNFYFRIDQTDAITKVLVEVNNTFGDRHIYPISNLQKESDLTYSGKTRKHSMFLPLIQWTDIIAFSSNSASTQSFLESTYTKAINVLCRPICLGGHTH